MRRLLAGVAVVAVLAASAACGGESTDSAGTVSSAETQQAGSLGTARQGDLTISSAWAAATMPNGVGKAGNQAPMSAGYAEITNAGGSDELLVGASSPGADMIELHETVDVDDSAGTMKPVDHIVVPAGGSVTLSPGGYHLMIMGLHHGLRPGSKLAVDLRFASGTRVPVEFTVIDRADRPGAS